MRVLKSGGGGLNELKRREGGGGAKEMEMEKLTGVSLPGHVPLIHLLQAGQVHGAEAGFEELIAESVPSRAAGDCFPAPASRFLRVGFLGCANDCHHGEADGDVLPHGDGFEDVGLWLGGGGGGGELRELVAFGGRGAAAL